MFSWCLWFVFSLHSREGRKMEKRISKAVKVERVGSMAKIEMYE
ncbi:hypothetical protein RV14_GL000544 [Enterococcus ratti]|uniref:Uncharacterized protein n=1 Tax=Enterococcus ratti TaxID=150033 RepID=A0A1L8WI90_9ENTE|nr:hypothetical protein RV14_GL000544 [Enterococcus ratti]